MALKRLKTIEPGPGRFGAPGRNIVGATAQVDLGDTASWKTWKFGNSQWQAESWRLYDIVGEFHFLANRIADSLAKARLYVTEVGEDGEESGEVTDESIRRLAAVPLGTGAQRDENLSLIGANLATAGEAWIVGLGAARKPEEAEGSWFVVTGAAIKNEAGAIKVRRPKERGAGWVELINGQDYLIRCWKAHPNDVDQADSFARSAIPVLREIELLTKREFAELDSRLTGAGMMAVPESIDFPREDSDPQGLAGFMAYMQRAMAASIRDQSSASALAPILFTVTDEMFREIDKLKPITFWSELSAEIGPMKESAIKRLATFAELPAEVLTGIGDTNHWSGWLISEEGIRWIGRYLSLAASALTRGFLRNALISMGVENPERYAFAFDTAPLAVRPNRLEEALQLHDRHLLSDEEVVKAGAFDAEQMPTTEELTRQRLWEVVKLSPDLIKDPAVQSALGLPEILGVDPSTPEEFSEPDVDAGAVNGPPELEGGDPVPAITASLDARIAAFRASAAPSPDAVFNAACKLTVYRALELAGGRLATPAERRGRWREVPRHELHHWVGPITTEKAHAVTAGAWNHIDATATDLGVDAGQLRFLLESYVIELLTRGMRHDDGLLYETVARALRAPAEVTA